MVIVTDRRIDGDALLTALSALANPHRLRILAALHPSSTYVSKLARDLNLSRPLLHMHLQKLAEAGLVRGETTVAEDGKAHRYFTVTDFAWVIDPASIAEAVRQGRARDFAAFEWKGTPADPQDPGTFEAARLRHELRAHGQHAVLYDLYRELLRLRREIRPLALLSKRHLEAVAYDHSRVLLLRRWDDDGTEVAATFHFGTEPAELDLPIPDGSWRKRLDSEEPRWHGPGSRLPDTLDSAGEVRLEVVGLLSSPE
jgi:DNA-binding transcriptional ArsR family regulator